MFTSSLYIESYVDLKPSNNDIYDPLYVFSSEYLIIKEHMVEEVICHDIPSLIWSQII